MFAIILLYFVAHLIHDIMKDGFTQLLEFTMVYEAVIISLCIAQLILYIHRVIRDTALHEDYLDNMVGYTSFIDGVSLSGQWSNINAVLVFMLTVWVSRIL